MHRGANGEMGWRDVGRHVFGTNVLPAMLHLAGYATRLHSGSARYLRRRLRRLQ
jgi:hypothetical protein